MIIPFGSLIFKHLQALLCSSSVMSAFIYSVMFLTLLVSLFLRLPFIQFFQTKLLPYVVINYFYSAS